jgi:uncharacterized protein YbaP (TraB family)
MRKNIKFPYLVTGLLAFFSLFFCSAQTKKKGKYPSLFWEITGNGLQKPSYLFGTMHVSSKKVFHLSDSFFYALKQVDVVAVETNPASWQDDYLDSDGEMPWLQMEAEMRGMMPNAYMHIKTLAFQPYEKQIERALRSNPAILNGLLYRNRMGMEDYEEDTFLDMYLFQAGRKLGKAVTGLENFKESNKLVAQAYVDDMKAKTKRKAYGYNVTPAMLEEAYRSGNLDLLDSLQRGMMSEAFLEKFLYRRNDIQGASIDTIVRKKQSVFAGVGAAHLGGPKGVIEYLRKKGYKLRPIFMNERDGVQKEEIEKMRVPLKFTRQYAADSLFSIEMPGKFYQFTNVQLPNQYQFADMANGAYYMVTRVPTWATMFGNNEAAVLKKVDSLLYTQIPGKILSKKNIERSGYKGVEVTNRTRRGDIQRYQIYITPFEVLVFKMSGNGDYVSNGAEADQFFNSISIQTPQPATQAYTPAWGGFAAKFPLTPYITQQKRTGAQVKYYAAYHEKESSTYMLVRAPFINFSFIEEDTFDLSLIDESFTSSAMVAEKISSKQGRWQGYPSLDCRYKQKDGSITSCRYVIQGPYYYTILAHGAKELPAHQQFLNSFSILPFSYPLSETRKDTAAKFTVKSPVFPSAGKSIQEKMHDILDNSELPDEVGQYMELLNDINIVVLQADSTTGEKIYIVKHKLPATAIITDSASLFKSSEINFIDSSQVYTIGPKKITAGGYDSYNILVKDTNSSRMFVQKLFYRRGMLYIMSGMTDTLTRPSAFFTDVFATFSPTDTATVNPEAESEAALFFKHYFGNDSSLKKKAIEKLGDFKLTPVHLPDMKRAIEGLSWKTKDYLRLKKNFIAELSRIDTITVTNYLAELYAAAGDTLELQQEILEALQNQQTKASYAVFNELMLKDPLTISVTNNRYDYDDYEFDGYGSGGSIFGNLYDSLALTKTLYPSFFELMNLDDYKKPLMALLGKLVDSGYVKANEYENLYNRFFLEARQQLKKQVVAEKQKEIEGKTNENNTEDKEIYYDRSDNDFSAGNELLSRYAVLLMPFWDTKPDVPLFFNQLLQLKDRKVKYDASLLMLRNGKKVQDTMWTYFAALPLFTVQLYDDLKEAKRLELFPKKYLSQKEMTYALLKRSGSTYYSARSIDTLVWLDKMEIADKGKKGWLHFYKYRDTEQEGEWKFAYAGIQPYNTSEADTDNTFVQKTEVVIDDEEPLKQQMQKIVKELLFSKRKSAAYFYKTENEYYNDLLMEE